MVNEEAWWVEQFAERRDGLVRLASGILGSRSDGEDAVQEAWLRLSRGSAHGVDNLGGWLTTVTSRIALDMLRRQRVRNSVPPEESDRGAAEALTPEAEAVLADAIGAALQIVVDTLRPAERVAFVLHDVFEIPFDDIARILGRSRDSAKQLASRARRKVHNEPADEQEPGHQRALIEAFLTASRAGDFRVLLELLDPDVNLEADDVAVRLGAPARLVGAESVAGLFVGRAQGAQPVEIDGQWGMVWRTASGPRVVWDVIARDGRVVHINMIGARDTIATLDLTPLVTPSGFGPSTS